RHVQTDHPDIGTVGGGRLLLVQQFTGEGVIAQGVLGRSDARWVETADADHGRGILGMLDDDPADVAGLPVVAGLGHQPVNGYRWVRWLVHLITVTATLGLGIERQRVAVIGYQRARVHVGCDEYRHAGIRQNQV